MAKAENNNKPDITNKSGEKLWNGEHGVVNIAGGKQNGSAISGSLAVSHLLTICVSFLQLP